MTQQVTASHLSRLACLYVRQSTLQQVLENTESTFRQYALRDRALALGWSDERIKPSHGFTIANAEVLSQAIYNCRTIPTTPYSAKCPTAVPYAPRSSEGDA